MTDFDFSDCGSICLLYPLTDDAVDWINQHIDPEAMRAPGGAVVIEHRYAGPVLEGIIDDGLTVG